MDELAALTVDRLRVFVSSTIRECREERTVIRDAVRSLNHEPILFEEIGARPYPPRAVYKPRLEASHVFIAVYRDSYGWVAPEMEVSGIEDEFIIADERRIDRLVYVKDGGVGRDPRLASLIDKAQESGITIAYYNEPEELHERVRADLTATISVRFVEQIANSEQTLRPDEVLSAVIPEPHQQMRRPGVEREVVSILAANRRAVVSGPLGAGKTILLAQLAAQHGWPFVDGRELDPLSLLAQCANAMNQHLRRQPVLFRTIEAARQSLLDAWQEAEDQTLVVDSPDSPLLLLDLLSTRNRLLLSTRNRVSIPPAVQYALPPLTTDEERAWVTAIRGRPPASEELLRLQARSEGNPLYLRFYSLENEMHADVSLQDLELRAFRNLPARAREALSYLSLAAGPLTLADLQDLLASTEEGPATIADVLDQGSALLRQSRGSVQIVHDHLMETVTQDLRSTQALQSFLAIRLGAHFEAAGNFVRAFHVYHRAGEDVHEGRVLDAAAHQASLQGGGAPAVPIMRRKAAREAMMGSPESQVVALLSLAQVLRQTGVLQEADSVTAEARATAQSAVDPAIAPLVEEAEHLFRLDQGEWEESLSGLQALRQLHTNAGRLHDAARVASTLSVVYIRIGQFPEAAAMAKEARDSFEALGDDYGVSIAAVNLASAMSRTPGQQQEASSILEELEKKFPPSSLPRQRAIVCNLLTARFRRLGQGALAKRYALEAIALGVQLGDYGVIAINQHNLGNVLHDEGLLDEALEAYRSADLAAVKAGVVREEATANTAIASVLNEKGEHSLALHHARHAVIKARSSRESLLIARAYEQQALALEATRDVEGAVNAYSDGAMALKATPDAKEAFADLVSSALKLCSTADRIDLLSSVLRTHFLDPQREAPPGETVLDILAAAVPEIVQLLPAHAVVQVVALSAAPLLQLPPEPIRRIGLNRALAAVIAQEDAQLYEGRLAAVAALLMVGPSAHLSLFDIAETGETIAVSTPGFYCKPFPDGAGHWTVRLDLGSRVIACIVQLDELPQTAVVGLLVALILRALAKDIRADVLDSENIARPHVVLNVVSHEEFTRNISPGLAEIPDSEVGFSIAESTDFSRDDQPPIVVICAPEFPRPWQPSIHPTGDLHRLLAYLLRVICAHLLAREVEKEVLLPKIGTFIRRFGVAP